MVSYERTALDKGDADRTDGIRGNPIQRAGSVVSPLYDCSVRAGPG